jgi:hypothetical protein
MKIDLDYTFKNRDGENVPLIELHTSVQRVLEDVLKTIKDTKPMPKMDDTVTIGNVIGILEQSKQQKPNILEQSKQQKPKDLTMEHVLFALIDSFDTKTTEDCVKVNRVEKKILTCGKKRQVSVDASDVEFLQEEAFKAPKERFTPAVKRFVCTMLSERKSILKPKDDKKNG